MPGYLKTTVRRTCLSLLLLWPLAELVESAPAPSGKGPPADRQLECPAATEPVRIDGRLHEWDFAQARVIDRKEALKYGKIDGEIDDDADCSARFLTGWDSANFYFAARVTDDRLRYAMEDVTAPWGCDSIQLYLQSTPGGQSTGRYKDKATSKYHPHPFLGLSLTPAAARNRFLPEGANSVAWPTEDGWAVEASIPFAALGYEVRSEDVVYFAIVLVDSDPGKKSSWGQHVWMWSPRGVPKGDEIAQYWASLRFAGQPAPKTEGVGEEHPVERQLVCPRDAGAVKIDGKLAEWDFARAHLIDHATTLRCGRIDGGLDHDADCSGAFLMRWDDKNFYFVAEVIDDCLRHAHNYTAAPWKCDSFQLYFRSSAEGRSAGRYQDKVTFKGQPHPFLGLSLTTDSTRNRFLPEGSNSISWAIENGWAVEASIPFAALGYDVRPGDTVSFGVVLVDCDIGMKTDWGQHAWMWKPRGAPKKTPDSEYWATLRFTVPNGAKSQ